MKIASNEKRYSHIGTGALLLTLLGTFSSGNIYAADSTQAQPPIAAPMATANADMTPPPPMPIVASPTSSMTPGADINKTVTALENKVTDNAKGLIKSLDASTDALTLEDLNSARQTVARIEALIDVEKHLAELEKVRNDRNGHSSSSFASVIPASALQPPPISHSMPVERDMPRPIIVMSAPEISRIMGSEGRYAAVIKVNNETKTVKAGDQLPNNTTVQSITASAVVLDENGKTRTLRVKNVDAIYSAMR